MFDHKHYVPFLKAKRGEFWALLHLKDETKAKMTPLLELLPHAEKSMQALANERMNQMFRAWGNRPFFFDAALAHPDGDDIATIFGAAAANNVHAIPVTYLADSVSIHSRIRQVASQQNYGAAIRLHSVDFNNPQTLSASITTVMNRLQLQPGRVDLLIDHGATHDAAVQLSRAHIQQLPRLNQWRTITVASGAFPESISNLPQNQWHLLVRRDWNAWLHVLTNAPHLSRKPTFGDYGIRDTNPPAEGGRASANIRYTADNNFLVRRGRQVQDGHAGDIRVICASLIARPEYSGVGFSRGDHCINAVINPPTTTGGAEQWTQWGMNHHFEKVVSQIESHNGL